MAISLVLLTAEAVNLLNEVKTGCASGNIDFAAFLLKAKVFEAKISEYTETSPVADRDPELIKLIKDTMCDIMMVILQYMKTLE